MILVSKQIGMTALFYDLRDLFWELIVLSKNLN
jgi:hypothetical protein